MQDDANSLHRRLFLGGTAALSVLGMAGAAYAQEPKGKADAKGSAADTVRVSRAIADFVTGFDLAKAPPEVVARSRAVFIDTVGVMLAGSHEEASHLVVKW